MRKTKGAVTGLLLCSVVTLLLTGSSSTQAGFGESSSASVTARSASASGTIVSNGPYASLPAPHNTLHAWTTRIPITESEAFVRGHDFTVTNTGNVDQYLSLKADLGIPENPNLTRNRIAMNHAKVKVFVGDNEVYSGLASQINTTPVRIPVGVPTTYRIDITGFYTAELDNTEPPRFWSGVPIKVRMSPSSNAQLSSWDTTMESYVWYSLQDYKIRADDFQIYYLPFDDNCIEVRWFINWPIDRNLQYSFRYSKNPNMSSAKTIELGYANAQLSGLSLNTIYYYQALAKTGFKEEWSPIMSFKTGSRDGGVYFDTCPSP